MNLLNDVSGARMNGLDILMCEIPSYNLIANTPKTVYLKYSLPFSFSRLLISASNALNMIDAPLREVSTLLLKCLFVSKALSQSSPRLIDTSHFSDLTLVMVAL